MIDYDKTIEQFFVDVEAYLTRRMEHAKDKIEAKKIQNTRFQWAMIKANPQKYINQKYDDTKILSPGGFLRGYDNSVYMAVRKVLEAIRNIYNDRHTGRTYREEEHAKEFLDAYKRWKIKSATSYLRGLEFKLRSAKALAVRSNTNTK